MKEKISTRIDWKIIIAIFSISFLLRLILIDLPLNTDETLWVSRGYNFLEGFWQGNWRETYQTHHPGVINMWIIGMSHYLNIWLVNTFPDWLTSPLQYPFDCLQNEPSLCPINAYRMPRFIQAIITSACMSGIYWLTRQLLGKWMAILGTLLLIFSPFFLAYQRFITTDALQADFSILAVLCLFLYLRNNHKFSYLITSGILMGLAISAKITSLFIVFPLILILILKELNFWGETFPRQTWLKTLKAVSIWGLILMATIFIVWPVLWRYPGEVWALLQRDLPQQATRGALYFLGVKTDAPNALFFPLVLIYRLSPLVQIGLLACLTTLVIPQWRKNEVQCQELTAIAIVALFPLIFLSLIESKIDRYIILVFPELILLAAAGWLQIGNWLKPLLSQIKFTDKSINYLAITVATMASILLLSYYPYFICYYNPVFGGAKVAAKIFMIGNGEGLDQAAQWLNKKQNAEQLTVKSWYEYVLASYFQGKTINSWQEADFIVVYINQIQRNNYASGLQEYLQSQQPLYVFKFHDLEYAKVYQGKKQ